MIRRALLALSLAATVGVAAAACNSTQSTPTLAPTLAPTEAPSSAPSEAPSEPAPASESPAAS